MDKYYTPQPFGNPPSLDDELAHDPGNSSHWSVPHPGYALTGPVDTAIYQSAQLAYPESSQRTIVSPDAYLYYGDVRTTAPHPVSLSAPPQLPREPYDQLGQGYYPSPYGYPGFASLAGSGTYESTPDSTIRDEGMWSVPSLVALSPTPLTPCFPTQTHRARTRFRASRRPRIPAMSPLSATIPRSQRTRPARIRSSSSPERRPSSALRAL